MSHITMFTASSFWIWRDYYTVKTMGSGLRFIVS
jgi:hypothetical protein